MDNEVINGVTSNDCKEDDEKEATELKPLKESNNVITDEKYKHRKLTLRERFNLIKDNVTIEPIMAFYIMPSALASLANQNLNLEKACRVNLNYTDDVCNALNLRQTENYKEYEEEVQKLIASVQAWKNAIQTTIPVLLILFVGAWSDKTGKRKACILTPIVGELLSAIGFIVNTYFFYELPVEAAALTEAIFPSITGGWFVMYMGAFSYIGDITSKEDRTFRVGLLSLCSTLGYPIGMALSGILLRWIGYYGVFSLSAFLYILSLIYGFTCLEEPKRKQVIEKEDGKGLAYFLKSFFDIDHVKNTFKVAFKEGPRNRRLRVVMLIVGVCVVFGPLHGEYTIMYLFVRFRFNWDEVKYSIFSTYSIVTNLLGTLFSVTLFSHYLKFDDSIIAIISSTSKILAAFGYAFARTDFEIYMAPLLEILTGTLFTALRSLATKLVSSEELGKVMSLFGLAEAMMPLLYGPLYSKVYMETLDVLPGAVFLLGAALTVPAILICVWLYLENKKDKELQKATVEKEKC